MAANMAAVARRINKSILFTNHKLPLIHSESVPGVAQKPAHTATPEIKWCRKQFSSETLLFAYFIFVRESDRERERQRQSLSKFF